MAMGSIRQNCVFTASPNRMPGGFGLPVIVDLPAGKVYTVKGGKLSERSIDKEL